MSVFFKLLKYVNALIMLGFLVVLTIFFGFAGFVVGAILAVIVSMWHSRYERGQVEKQRHEEMLKAIQKNQTS